MANIFIRLYPLTHSLTHSATFLDAKCVRDSAELRPETQHEEEEEQGCTVVCYLPDGTLNPYF